MYSVPIYLTSVYELPNMNSQRLTIMFEYFSFYYNLHNYLTLFGV